MKRKIQISNSNSDTDNKKKSLFLPLRKKRPYSQLFWPVFSPNVGKYGPE